MKKIYVSIFAFLWATLSFAQVSSYTFTSSSGTYTAITGGTVIGQATSADPAATPESATMDDFTYVDITIPFSFTFNGQAYTAININTNGWASFGAVSTSTSSPISSSTAYNGVISAFSNDMMGIFAATGTRAIGSNVITAVSNTSKAAVGALVQGAGIPAGATITAFDATTITLSVAATTASTGGFFSWATGEIRVETIGSAPNRTFVIQFKGLSEYSSIIGTTNNTSADFQIRISEGGGIVADQVVQVIYGNVFRAAGTESPQVGLRGLFSTDFNNRTSTTDWAATTAGGTNAAIISWTATVNPASGLTFTWTPNLSAMDFVNLHSPASATIALGGSATVYTQGFEAGLTEAAGAGAGINAWIGTNAANTDPSNWPASAWVPATFNVQVGTNDEFSAAIGSTFGAGTFYYASRWQLAGGMYKFGGYSASGGGFWNGTTNVSGVLTVTPTVANDVCSGATVLTVHPDLACGTTTAGTTVGSTLSQDLPTPTCSSGGINDDVWFSFTATGPSHILTLTAATNATAAQIYSGSCGSLVTMSCSSTTSGALSLQVNGLTAANVYLVRVYSTSTTVTTTSNFTICIGTPPPPPANDNVCGATPLAVSSAVTCTTSLTGQSTQYATQSLVACVGTADEDVWYSFVATSTSHTVTLTNSGAGAADRVHQVFSSADNTCAGILTSIGCSDPETSTVSGLTIGNTYFVRVHSYGSTNYSTFDICITTPPPPPANDGICAATALTVNPLNTCTTALTGQSTQSATQSLAGCLGTADEDVWYSFIATGPNHTINIISSGAGSTDRVHQVFSSSDNSCSGTLTSIGCSDPEQSTVGGLTPGNTYFVRVYSYGSGNYATFNICITTPVPPPVNDICSGAITVAVNASCVPQTFNTSGATDNNETGDCTAGTEAAVWFKFVATATNATVTVDGAVGFDAVLGVLNACGAATSPTGGACVDATTDGGVETRILTGLTVGNTYYIQVYDYQGDATADATFDLCVVSVNCLAPTAVSTGTITLNGATVTWTGTGSFILEYGLSGFTPGTGPTAGTGGTVINPATSPQVLTGLSQSTGYNVYVRQDCTGAGAGFSSNSSVTSFTTAGPPPANDECGGAILLASTPVAGTTLNATQSRAAEVCGGFTSSAANDVWYQFTATANGTATVTVSGVTIMDPVLQGYSGTCGALSNIACADANASTSPELMVMNGLVLGQTYYVRIYGYNGLRGNFNIVVSGAAVPVTVEYFKGSRQNSGNLLDWKVACYNSPTATMVLERSNDARKFDAINSITETATRCLQPFSFVDASPLAGINYYRLKTIDADGKESYSTIVAIMNKDKGFAIVSLMPNPVQTTAILTISSAAKTTMQVVVSDLAGKQLSIQNVTLVAGSNQLPLKLANLASGTYQVTGVSADGKVTTLRFVKE